MSGCDSVSWEEEVAKKGKRKERGSGEWVTLGQRLRGLNILFPWFKVVAGFLMMTLVVVVTIGMVRREGIFAQGVDEVAAEGGEDAGDAEVAGVSESMDDSGDVGTSESSGAGSRRQSETKQGVTYVKAKPSDLAIRGREGELEGKKLIALTFDDGPTQTTTVRLLEILKEKEVRATFFVIGKMAQVAPEILKREEQEGHVVGSHTMGHVNLTTLDVGAIRQDMTGIDGVFQGSLGHVTRLVRPPYGAINETVQTEVRQPLVIWSIDPEDWKTKDAEAIRKHVAEKAFDGAIVLMHDIYESTVDAVAGMIDDLRKEGYEFVTVPELARVRGVTLEAGGVYGSFRP